MFYKVKVFDSQGQLKKVVSSKKLSNQFWANKENLPSYYDDRSGKSEDWNSSNKTKVQKLHIDQPIWKVDPFFKFFYIRAGSSKGQLGCFTF